MKQLVLPWWRDRTARERVLLAVLAALVAALLAWFAVLEPLRRARLSADAGLAEVSRQRADVERLGREIRLAERRAAGGQGSATEIITRRLAEAGLAADRVEAQGGGSVSVHVPAVRAVVLLPWLQALEQRDGLVIESVAIARNPDPSVAVTLVARRAG